MSVFKPFQNDSQSVGLGDLTLENQGQQVNLYGSATFTIDKQSLATAKELQGILAQIIDFLEVNQAQTIEKADIVKQQQQQVDEVNNPFL